MQPGFGKAIQIITLRERGRRKTIRRIELHLGSSGAATQAETRQAIQPKQSPLVTALLCAEDDEPMILLKFRRPTLPDFPLMDPHREISRAGQGRCQIYPSHFRG